ncbi:MAG: InlB B-repeat-containing protein [Bacilli bacterium]|nr:InlB B-repeat-containing protein [Bacilli bacterium]
MKYINKIVSLFAISLFVLGISACQTGGGTGSGGSDTPNEDYCISFNTNGGNEIKNVKNLNVGDVVNLPTPERPGYMFAGWYESEDFSTSKLSQSYTYNGKITLHANWYPKGYTISLVSNEVSLAVKEYSFKYEQEIIIPEPTSDYYDFMGWYDQEGNLFEMTTMPANDIILTAKWQGKKITVNFDLQGGVAPSGFESVVNLNSGETLNLLNPTKDGNLFKGWYDEKGNKYTSSTSILTSVTLYAKWDALTNYDSTYSINYVLNDGKLPSGTKHEYNVGIVTTLPIPTKDGYEFVGWFTSEIFYGEKVTSISEVTIGELTFYAKWKEVKSQYSVTFIDHTNKATVVNVNSGSKVTKQSLPTHGGAELTWYLGNTEFNFDTLITEDITLQANFKMLAEKLPLLVPSVFYDSVTLNNSVSINTNYVKTVWTSSDVNTLTNGGITNPDRVDKVISLKCKFTYNSATIEQTFEVIVPKVELKDLSDGKPVFAYVYASSYKGFTETAKNTLEVVNLSFGRVTDESTVSLEDVQKYLFTINQIRKSGVRVVLSIGGADSSSLTKFSNTAATTETRLKFARSILEILETYHLDGVDIDWEYPGYNTGRDIEEDKPNYTLLMAQIYQTLKEANPDYLVTAALPGGRWGIERYNVRQVIDYLDYLHLMTYDFHDSNYAYHHTALYGSSNTSSKSNVHDSVLIYNNAGAPLSKIVIGVAFYGRVYIFNGSPTTENGLGSGNVGSSGGHMTYTNIYNYMKNNKGSYVTCFDSTACATAIYIPSENKLISFDNPNSIKAKCNYVWAKDLGGLMYWENGEDTTDLLLQAIESGMKKA